MHDLFNDPEANSILALAGFWPLTIGEVPGGKLPPALGEVMESDADGNVLAVREVPMSISYN